MRLICICKGLGVIALLSTAAVLTAQQGDTAYLKTNVNPGRAGVFVDGKYVGPAGNFRIGRKYALPAGQHQIKLVDPRFEEHVGENQRNRGDKAKGSCKESQADGP